MTQTAMPLYPKISSIYNKIMQLAIAIVFIIVLMNIWIENVQRDQQVVNQHFKQVGDNYIHQTNISLRVLLAAGNRENIQVYLDNLVDEPYIASVLLYDETGQLTAQAGDQRTVVELFGLAPNTLNIAENTVPFVSEIRAQKVLGYVRVNMVKAQLVQQLNQENNDQQQLVRIMLIMAGLAGFFLTRGLSRFSRQGFRVMPPQ